MIWLKNNGQNKFVAMKICWFAIRNFVPWNRLNLQLPNGNFDQIETTKPKIIIKISKLKLFVKIKI